LTGSPLTGERLILVVGLHQENYRVTGELRIPAKAFLFCVLMVGLGSIPVEGQARWEMPLTQWGHPDLQGNWSNKTLTPIERADGVGLIYTPAQLDSVERAQQAVIQTGIAPSDPNRPPPAFGDIQFLSGAYNEIYFERDRVAFIDGAPRSSLVTFPENGRIPELSASGQRRIDEIREFIAGFGESDNPEHRTQSDQCLASFGSNMGPPMLPNGLYNNNYTIVQNEDHVLIATEMVHDTRIIRFGEPTPLPEDFRPWWGVSWGHWEGNTLVAETTNIYPRQIFLEGRKGIRHSENVRVIERFTRVDEETILYEFEVDDADTYSERWGGQVPMRRFNDLLFEYACHEGNHAMEGILSGARYQERMGTAGANN
jgi:hypothetical protein